MNWGLRLILGFLFNWLGWWTWINTIGRVPMGLSWFSVLAFDLLSVGFWIVWTRRSVRTGTLRWTTVLSEFWRSFGSQKWILPAAIAIGSALFYTVLIEPIDWDGLDYHLPPILQAVQYHQWGLSEDPYYAVSAYPMLVESLYLYWILHFGHHLFLLLGLLPWAMGAVAIDTLAQHFQISRRWTFLLWATVPLIVKQASTLYIDHFVAVFGILACVGLVQKREILFSVALAFFAGAKFSAFLPAGILTLSWMLRYRKVPWSLALIGGVTLAGTLIPNWIRFGNPVFPFSVNLAGFSLFPGEISPSNFVSGMAWIQDPWYVRFGRALFSIEPVPHWDMVRGPIGYVQGALVVLGIGGWFWELRGFRGEAKGWTKLGTGLILPEAFLALALISGNWMLRYHLWVCGGLLLLAARTVERFPKAIQRGVWVALVFQASWLWIDRVWLIGNAEPLRAAIQERNPKAVVQVFKNRWSELRTYGEPQTALNQVDQQRIVVRKTKNQVYVFDKKARPQQLAAYYGRDFSNQVRFR